MNRRQFLGVSGGLLPTITGCFGQGTSIAPPSTVDSPPASSPCPDDSERVDVRWTVKEGPLAGFALDLTTNSIAFGEQVTVKLRNVTDEERITGNEHKYDIERQTDAGWQSIFWNPKIIALTEMAIPHAPGEGFTWTMTVTTENFRSNETHPAYSVCEPLETGTYRFVYWGVTPKEERENDYETDYALGSNFTVTQS